MFAGRPLTYKTQQPHFSPATQTKYEKMSVREFEFCFLHDRLTEPEDTIHQSENRIWCNYVILSAYLSELLHVFAPSRTLRSSSDS